LCQSRIFGKLNVGWENHTLTHASESISGSHIISTQLDRAKANLTLHLHTQAFEGCQHTIPYENTAISEPTHIGSSPKINCVGSASILAKYAAPRPKPVRVEGTEAAVVHILLDLRYERYSDHGITGPEGDCEGLLEPEAKEVGCWKFGSEASVLVLENGRARAVVRMTLFRVAALADCVMIERDIGG
jgi:hypothetical protein